MFESNFPVILLTCCVYSMYVSLYPNELKRGAELDMPECIATNVIHLERVWVEQQDKPQLIIKKKMKYY